MNRQISRDFGSRLEHWAMFLVLFAIVAIVMAWPFLFKSQSFAYIDVGGDTFVQFYPLNVLHAQQMAIGDGFNWSFNLGLGSYSGSHFDPFWMVQAMLPESVQLQARIFFYLAKLLLAGLFFLGYLRAIGIRPELAVVGGLAYAFSGYALINGQWDLHGTEVLHFAALVYLLERYLRSGRLEFAVLIGLLLGAGHSFNLHTSALFSAMYVVIRLLLVNDKFRVGRWLQGQGLLVLGVVSGILILAPLQLTSLSYFLDSPRVGGGYPSMSHILAMAASVNDWRTIASEIFGLLGKDIMGRGNDYTGWSNYLEGPGFYVGLPFLLMATQLATRAATGTERRLFWLAVLGIGLYFVFPALRYAVFGFGHVAFRVSTLWISMLILVVGVLGIQRSILTGLSRPALLLATVFVVGLCVAAWLVLEVDNLLYVSIAITFVAIYWLVFLFPDRTCRGRTGLVLGLVLAAELLLLTRPGLVDRDLVSDAGIAANGLRYDDGSEKALEWIRSRHGPEDFYRVEKNYHSVFLLDSLIQGYRGIRSYFFHGAGVTRFVDLLSWPRTVNSANYIEADLSRGDILDLLSVRYLLARVGSSAAFADARLVNTIAGIQVFERPSARSPAVLHARVVPESDARRLPLEQRDRILLEAVVVADDSDLLQLANDDSNAGAPVPATLKIHSDTELSGRYHSETPRVLALAYPYDRGWSLRVNGDPLPLHQVNFGLAGALVPAGESTFELRYQPRGRSWGWRVAPIALLISLLLVYLQRWRHRQLQHRLGAY